MAKERRRTASSFTIFSIDVTGNAGVFVWVFLSCCHTHVNKNHITAGMVRVSCNCLYAGETFVQWDHGMHPWALGVLIVENGYHRGP